MNRIDDSHLQAYKAAAELFNDSITVDTTMRYRGDPSWQISHIKALGRVFGWGDGSVLDAVEMGGYQSVWPGMKPYTRIHAACSSSSSRRMRASSGDRKAVINCT